METSAVPQELRRLTDEEAERHPHVMRVMDETGDTAYGWDPNDVIDVELAKKQFDTMRGKGYAAFKTDGEGGKTGRPVTTFDAHAAEYVYIKPLQGG